MSTRNDETILHEQNNGQEPSANVSFVILTIEKYDLLFTMK